jgi:hypothetical protein
MNRQMNKSKPPKRQPADGGGAASVVARIVLALLGIACAVVFALRVIPSATSQEAPQTELIALAAGALVCLCCVLWLSVAQRERPRKTQPDPLMRPMDGPVPIHTLIRVTESRTRPVVAGRPSTDTDELPLDVEIDPIFFSRLDEYKSYRPTDGCVILVTETAPPDPRDQPYLNGALAAMSAARKVAEYRGMPTLLIDAGSPVWSVAAPGADPVDVIPLPDVPGVYEILAETEQLVDCILAEDELPGLTAIAPGNIPENWAGKLQSPQMRMLVALARTAADLIMVYAPRLEEHPEAVRALCEWSNCVLLVTPSEGPCGPMDFPEEDGAASALRAWGATVFGRIALVHARNAEEKTPLQLSATQVMSGQAQPGL